VKILYPNFILNNLNVNEFEKYALRNKIKNLEVSPFFLKTKKFNYKSRIKPLILSSLFYKVKNHNDENYIKELINIAEMNKIKEISIGNYNFRMIKNYELNKKFIKKICNSAARKNIVVNIEPISQKYNSKFLTDFISIIKFIKKEKIKNLRALFDTGNFMENKDCPYKGFLIYKKYINHIHLRGKNIKKFNKALSINFLKFLKKNKYKKKVTIEVVNKNKKILKKIIKSIEAIN